MATRSCSMPTLWSLQPSTTYRIILQPYTSCLRTPPQQQFLTSRRLYATAKTKIRATPRTAAPPPPRPARTSPSLPRTKTPSSPTASPPPPLRTPTYVSASTAFAQTLASKSSPTLLYLAPASNTYMLTCYALSGFCIAYGAINFYQQIIAPRDTGLWWAIPVSIGGVSLLTAALGVRVALSARRLVKSVTAVPRADGGVVLRLEARTLLAVLGKGQVVEVPVSRARLSRRVAAEQARKPAHATEGGFAARREAERKREREREYEMAHLWSAPFRHFASGARKAVASLQRLVLREGFVQILVDKRQVWRLDAKNGWAMDEGVALDRLIGPVGVRK